jgi:hypothetical protein
MMYPQYMKWDIYMMYDVCIPNNDTISYVILINQWMIFLNSNIS